MAAHIINSRARRATVRGCDDMEEEIKRFLKATDMKEGHPTEAERQILEKRVFLVIIISSLDDRAVFIGMV